MIYKIKQFALSLICLSVLFVLCYFTSRTMPSDYGFQNRPVAETEIAVAPKELFFETWELIRSNYWDRDLNEQDWGRWKARYYNKIKTEEDAYVAINSMLASLNDPYSRFMNRYEFKEQSSSIDSKIYGIGINIVSISGKIYIMNVVKGAPADLGGLKSGDMILKINGNNVKGDNIFQTANYIKNGDLPFVDIEVLRGKKRIAKKIKRAEIKVKTVEAEVIDKKIGYIKISSFISSDTPFEFVDALNKTKLSEALILDLRGNTGGLFQNAVFVANAFLKKGNIVKVIGRGGQKSLYDAQNKEYVCDKPLVVLVDKESASASEIVSAALKDNGRAVVVGTKTFGKGVVQKVYPMSNKMGMNLTVARYLTPTGLDINKKGVEPDYTVEITREDWKNNNDAQLNFAKNLLLAEIEREKIAGSK